MSLNRLQPNASLEDDGGRFQLQETLDLISKAISNLRVDAAAIKDSIPPAAYTGFPLVRNLVKGKQIGDIFTHGVQSVPSNALECNNQAVSRTTYEALFDVIGTGFGVGDGSTTFNVPDLRGRSPEGLGTGDATGHTATSVGTKKGTQTRQQTTAEVGAHAHDLSAHTHVQTDHQHTVNTNGSGAGSIPLFAMGASTASVIGTNVTNGFVTAPLSTGAPSSDTTSTSPASAFYVNQGPHLGVPYYIQTARGGGEGSLDWGQVPASWAFDNDFPLDSLANIQGAQNATIRAEASGGTGTGSTSEIKVTAIIRVPENFAGWAHNAIKIKSQLKSITGTSGSAVVTARIRNPLSASGFLSATRTRTVAAASGTISESEATLTFTAEDLGDSWAAGYPLAIELEFAVPKTFTLCQIEIGELQILWT